MTTGPPPAADDGPALSGIERAVFGAVPFAQVRSWLEEYARTWLPSPAREILFRSGRLAAVYGLRLADGTEAVVKVRAGQYDLDQLRAVASCQRTLAGYPGPRPAAEPVAFKGLTVTSERLLADGEPGDAHQPAVRKLMADGLFEHLTILRDEWPGRPALRTPPAWADYEAGPWPAPHDPVFDFSVTPPGYEWLDHLAAAAAAAIGPRQEPDALAHSDWICLNLRFRRDRIGSAYDWESLLAHSEPVLAGLAAGAYTDGSTTGASAPTPAEARAFLADYQQARAKPFSAGEMRQAAGAAVWVSSYNARCVLDLQAKGIITAGPGTSLAVVSAHRSGFLSLVA